MTRRWNVPPMTPFEALDALLHAKGWQTATPSPAQIRAHADAHPFVEASEHRSAGSLWAVRDAEDTEDVDLVILRLRGTELYYCHAHLLGEESKLEYLERGEVTGWLPLTAKAVPVHGWPPAPPPARSPRDTHRLVPRELMERLMAEAEGSGSEATRRAALDLSAADPVEWHLGVEALGLLTRDAMVLAARARERADYAPHEPDPYLVELRAFRRKVEALDALARVLVEAVEPEPDRAPSHLARLDEARADATRRAAQRAADPALGGESGVGESAATVEAVPVTSKGGDA